MRAAKGTGPLLRAAAALALTALGGAGQSGSGDSSRAQGGEATRPQVSLRPGEWELKAEVGDVTTAGLPPGYQERARKQAARAAGKSRICITPAEANGPRSGIFATDNARNCRSEGIGWSGGRIQGRTLCPRTDGTGTVEMILSGRYGADTMELTLNMKTQRPGQSATMETRITGRRVGDCSAGRKGS
jgi:hypothetical protein